MTTSGLMPQVLSLAWRTVRSLHGKEVTYDYGTGTKTLVAVKSRPNVQAVSGDETIVESSTWDFLIDPADLVIDGIQTIPGEGFQITEQDGTKFRLMPGDSGNLCWRWSDPHKTFVRCFCEEIS